MLLTELLFVSVCVVHGIIYDCAGAVFVKFQKRPVQRGRLPVLHEPMDSEALVLGPSFPVGFHVTETHHEPTLQFLESPGESFLVCVLTFFHTSTGLNNLRLFHDFGPRHHLLVGSSFQRTCIARHAGVVSAHITVPKCACNFLHPRLDVIWLLVFVQLGKICV